MNPIKRYAPTALVTCFLLVLPACQSTGDQETRAMIEDAMKPGSPGGEVITPEEADAILGSNTTQQVLTAGALAVAGAVSYRVLGVDLTQFFRKRKAAKADGATGSTTS